jgi:hypothetical protein
MAKVHPRNKAGVIVHANSKIIPSNHTAKNVYGNVNYAKTFIQGSGMVPLQRMQKEDNLHMQQMHAQNRKIAEAVFILQSHDGVQEQVLC